MKNSNVLPKHLRIAALQVNYEGGDEQTLKVPALWKEFGFNTVELCPVKNFEVILLE